MSGVAYPLANTIDFVEGIPTVDLNDGANTGDWVSLKNADWMMIKFKSGTGTAGDDPSVIVQQATSNAGGSAKALNIVTSPVQIHKKQATTSLAAVTTWAEADGDVTTNTWTDTDSAEQSLILVIGFRASDLDVANGFDHIRATIADVGGNNQPGDLEYVPQPMYGSKPTQTPSYIS